MRKMNKKGMMDDFFDFIFTVIIAFFLFSFIFWTLDYSVQNSNEASMEVLRDYQRLDSGVNNLRSAVYLGYNYEGVDLNAKIKETKVLGGKTITNCNDYFTKEDCDSDRVASEKTAEYKCAWNEEMKKCEILRKAGAVKAGK